MMRDESVGFVQRAAFRLGNDCALVRWYLRQKLSSRDLVQMMAERGIALEHNCDSALDTTVPEFEKRWSQYSRSVGKSWLCDETDIKVKGHWT